MNENQPFACDLTAIPADVRQQHIATIPEIFQAVQAVRELSNGYAFQFLNEPGRFMALAQFVQYEQLCCPFEGLTLEIEPNGGPIWLRLTGGEGYKQALGTAFGDMHEAARMIKTGPGDYLDETIDRIAPVMADMLKKAVPLPNDAK